MRVALIDGNAFYASCETIFRPDLRDKPVVVLSNNDGCIVALNQRAKDIGIERTTPLFQVKGLIENHGIAVFSSNYTLYGDISNRIREIYRRFSPMVEDYSIDETFLWFTDGEVIPSALIRDTILRWTGIPVSIGIGPTKTLAKCANKLSKKVPSGCFEIKKSDIQEILKAFPVEKVWGIGRATASALESWGVKTALEFTRLDPFKVKKRFSIQGWRIQRELLGEPQINIEEPEPKDNLISSKSFSHPVTELMDLQEAVAEYAAGAVEKLRSQKSVSALVSVGITTNYFNLKEPQYSQSICLKLPHPSCYTPDFVGASLKGLGLIFKPGYKYKKASVMLMAIEPLNGLQGNLFIQNDPKIAALQDAVDEINRRYGRNFVHCSPKRKTADWMMRRDACSPRYTTQWSEILKVP